MHISDVNVGPNPAEMSPETAIKIFPIAHHYGMQVMIDWCMKAFEKSKLDLWPSDPIASSEVPNHPGLVQCLALADAKQCDSLVESCLSQLMKPGTSDVRNALVSPHLDKLVDGLRPETKDRIIRGMAGLPTDFKVINKNDNIISEGNIIPLWGCIVLTWAYILTWAFLQASIPSLGKVKPFMTKEISIDGWGDLPADEICPYFAMSDRLMLFPKNKTSTMVWDIEDDRMMGVLEGHTSTVFNFTLNNAGSTAVSIAKELAALPYIVRIWNLETMQHTATLPSSCHASSLLEDRLLLGSMAGPIKVWDLGGNAPVSLMDLHGHARLVSSIFASGVVHVTLSGSYDKSVRLWDLRTGQCARVMEGHAFEVVSVSMDSACRTAVSGSNDGTAKSWDLGSGRCIQTYEHDSIDPKVMMHESGGSYLTAGRSLDRRLYSIKAWTTLSGHDQPILDADLSSLCGFSNHYCPSVAASRDLQRMGMCYLNADGRGLMASVWK